MKTTTALITVLALTLTAPAFATSVRGTIGTGNNFSVIHDGATPGGLGDHDDWKWFDAGQSVDLILEEGILTLAGEQTFSLYTPSTPQDAASVTFQEIWLALNDASDGFAGGYIEYTLDGTLGTFTFADDNYGQSPFNSSNWLGNELTVYVWGGDTRNGLGIDLALTTIVPEPGVLALFLLGLTGVIVQRRRASAAGLRC